MSELWPIVPVNLLVEAQGLLSRFGGLSRLEAAALAEQRLYPEPEDLERVFAPELCEAARLYYDALWASAPAPLGESDQTRLLISAASVQQLRSGEAPDFPGGYARIAGALVPGPVWFRWRWTRPTESVGMAFDGLVHLPGGRWAWFPKPWRMLA